jgi:hypothetical protein
VLKHTPNTFLYAGCPPLVLLQEEVRHIFRIGQTKLDSLVKEGKLIRIKEPGKSGRAGRSYITFASAKAYAESMGLNIYDLFEGACPAPREHHIDVATLMGGDDA